MKDIAQYIESCGKRAQSAARQLSNTSNAQRHDALVAMARALRLHRDDILEANAQDIAHARAEGLSEALCDRLTLNDARLELMASSIENIAEQPDVVGRIEDARLRPNGLKVARMRIPLGVIAIIYEARPNVTSDAAALCLKSGNAVVLKGGHEALRSNRIIAHLLQEALESCSLPRDAIILVDTADREAVQHLIRQKDTLDLLIPRGGEGLIRFVSENARVPVIQHYKGVCHIFVEKTADLEKAIPIVVNAKCQRPGVCNAMETLLLDAHLSLDSQARILRELHDRGVLLHADTALMNDFGKSIAMVAATDDDWPREYLALELAVARVAGLEGALRHIETYTSFHTEAVITEDPDVGDEFLRRVQSSTVLVNASTRFADGGELGLGAEIGISTTKLHAFGPMGCEDLTTRKFIVMGDGQTRS